MLAWWNLFKAAFEVVAFGGIDGGFRISKWEIYLRDKIVVGKYGGG